MNLVYLHSDNPERIEMVKSEIDTTRLLHELGISSNQVLALYDYMGCVLCVEILANRFAVYINREKQLSAPGALGDIELLGEPALSMLLLTNDHTIPGPSRHIVYSEERLYKILKKIMNYGEFRHGKWLLEPDDDLL